MNEWTEKHRTFNIGEKVTFIGRIGVIHSRDYPMNTYYIDFSNDKLVVASPFEIEPCEE